jgi:hypothetical protein
MKKFEVNFIISGNYLVDAENEEKAKNIVNEIINSRWKEIENVLRTGIKEEDYVTDVIEIQ